MTTLFLDTGYLIALEASDDQHHQAAREHWRNIANRIPSLITTTYVFDEVVTFFNSRNRHSKAVEIGNRLQSSRAVELIQVDRDLFLNGWERLQRRPDKRYSLTDCISFVVMERRQIDVAMTFDQHFSQEGFRMVPGKEGQ